MSSHSPIPPAPPPISPSPGPRRKRGASQPGQDVMLRFLLAQLLGQGREEGRDGGPGDPGDPGDLGGGGLVDVNFPHGDIFGGEPRQDQCGVDPLTGQNIGGLECGNIPKPVTEPFQPKPPGSQEGGGGLSELLGIPQPQSIAGPSRISSGIPTLAQEGAFIPPVSVPSDAPISSALATRGGRVSLRGLSDNFMAPRVMTIAMPSPFLNPFLNL